VYSVAPAGVFVRADSELRTPDDLAGVPISVGYQSGSHYATIQALEQYLPPDRIALNFADGMLFSRMEKFIEGRSPACTLFSGDLRHRTPRGSLCRDGTRIGGDRGSRRGELDEAERARDVPSLRGTGWRPPRDALRRLHSLVDDPCGAPPCL
jgi:hypothetical protein